MMSTLHRNVKCARTLENKHSYIKYSGVVPSDSFCGLVHATGVLVTVKYAGKQPKKTLGGGL